MLKHLILTAFTLVIVISIIMMALGTPDPATTATADAYLKIQKPSADLPAVCPPGEAGDAGTIYQQAFDYYKQHQVELNGRRPPAGPIQHLRDMLVQAVGRRDVTDGFADQSIPLEPGATPDWGNAPTRMADLICRGAKEQNSDDARQSFLGVWALGQRLFEHNVRLFPRRTGMGAMETAAMYAPVVLGKDSPVTQAMAKWNTQLLKINDAWQNKVDGVFKYDPSVGDLLRVAELDEDRTFRLEAVLQMGVVRWTKANNRGDLRAIRNALAGYVHDKDPLIAAAAKAANAMTREQVRALH